MAAGSAVGSSGQQGAHGGNVAGNLLTEGFGSRKSLLRPQGRSKLHPQLFAVDLGVEIEQMHFAADGGIGVTEGGATAEIQGPEPFAIPMPDPHGVYTEGR